MVQWVDCLLSKQEGLSSDPLNAHKHLHKGAGAHKHLCIVAGTHKHLCIEASAHNPNTGIARTPLELTIQVVLQNW